MQSFRDMNVTMYLFVTYTGKQECSQLHTFQLWIIHLLCFTFTPYICEEEAEVMSK